VERSAASSSAVARSAIDELVLAVNEVLTNGLVHGRPPVQLSVWVEPASLTCQVTDAGPGIDDPLAGFRHPEPTGPRGLWAARQLCEGLYLGNEPDAGCRVLLTTA
jgi:anti-sigma regulatory factor (Ser/Thr protein kinase)